MLSDNYREMEKLLSALDALQDERGASDVANIVLNMAIRRQGSLDALVSLLRGNQYPTASVRIASELVSAYGKSHKKALEIFAGILQSGNREAIDEALLGIGIIVWAMDRDDRLDCDDLTKEAIVKSWSPNYEYQSVWGRVFAALGAQDVALQYVEKLGKRSLGKAIELGVGAGLEESVDELLPIALRSNDDDVIDAALFAVEEFRFLPKYLDEVRALLSHPNEEIRKRAAELLAKTADEDKSGRARKMFAEYLSSHPDSSLAILYFAYNRGIDWQIVDAMLDVCVAEGGGKSASRIIDRIVGLAKHDTETAKEVLAYQPPNKEKEKYYRKLVRRIGIRLE